MNEEKKIDVEKKAEQARNYAYQNYEYQLKQINRIRATAEKLATIGIDIPDYTGAYIKVEAKDLPKIRKVLGKFTLYSRTALDMTTVRVYLSVADIVVYYDRPYKGEGRCKIVETTHKSAWLVCE